MTVVGQVQADASVNLGADDDLELAGGSLRSDGPVEIQAGLDGSGSVLVGAPTNGGLAIDSGDSLHLSAADDIEIGGDVHSDGDAQLAAGFDVRFSGGQLSSGGKTHIVAGQSGAGNVLGSPQTRPDVVATKEVFVSAPDSIGGNSPLEVNTDGELQLQGRLISVAMQPVTSGNPAELRVTGLNGGMAQEVNLDIKGASDVILRTFVVGNGEVTTDSANLQVRQGNLGDWASFRTPYFNARIDHLDRNPPPGMDVRGFTLDGDFDLELTPTVAYIGAYVINQNPRRIVQSNPGGYVDRTNGESLRTQGQIVLPGLGNIVPSGAPASGNLVTVASDLMDEERLLEQDASASPAP
jgi:hypothetical protein